VNPVLFEFDLPLIGKVVFPAYMTLFMTGFLVCLVLARRRAEKHGLNGTRVVDLGLVMLVAGIVGARALAVVTDGKLDDFVHLCTDPTLVDAPDARTALCSTDAECGWDYVCNTDARPAVQAGERATMCHPPKDCLAVFKFWQGGLTFYGGLLLAIPIGLWFACRTGLGAFRMADLAAPLIMLGLAVGRLGCFLNGCCYGAPTTSRLGVRFPHSPLPLHPTQLYEGGIALILFLLLSFWLRPRQRGDGELFGWMLVLYGAIRPALELLRADPRGALGPISTSQLISIPLVGFGVWLIVRARRGPRPASLAT
jgi:phosphatidylglycerol:prolipoprotein diacylglycerol transferase